MKSKIGLTCIILALALSVGGIYAVNAGIAEQGITGDGDGFFPMGGWRMPHRGFWGSLTEEQRNELHSEIRDLVESKLDEWGIEPPEPLLTEDQRAELQEYIEDLREEGYSPQEIREKISEKLESWGVELPEPPINNCRFRRRGRFMNKPLGGMWKGQPDNSDD